MVDSSAFLRCEAVAWVDEDWPGWFRVRLIDAAHRPWHFVDKVSVFFPGSAGPSTLPAALIQCRIIDHSTDGLFTVSTAMPDGVEAEDETTVFRVRIDQVQRHPT
jgi:hypothetical protein